MMPAPPAARRLPILGCAALALVALVLSACGEDGAATADNTAAAAAPKARAKGAAIASGAICPRPVRRFVSSLDSMRRQLAVGLSYEQYAAKVEGLNRAYDEIPVDHLAIGCLATAGTPAERALNKYIDGVNAWGECLADASCSTASIEPVLQRKWRLASHLLSEAQ